MLKTTFLNPGANTVRFSFFRIFVLTGFFIFPIVSLSPAVVQAEAVSGGIQAPVAEPLTVTGVLVDKTAENAVVARDQAIAEARKTAFQMLAERNMTPEQVKDLSLPDDQTLSALVQDFEIENEQLSATRYVASFTVRFRAQVKNYIDVKYPVQETGQAPLAQGTGAVLAVPVVGAAGLLSKPLLVLPYFEDISGRTLLWEDANPWREVWQSFAPILPQGEGPLFVPLGDIGDIGTGPSNAVWSGDYSVVEALQKNYGAENVVLAVANKSGPTLMIDVYVYAAGRLQRWASLTPYVGGKDEQAALRQGMLDVFAFLRKPEPQTALTGAAGVEGISQSLLPRATLKKGNAEGDIHWESGWSNPVTMESSVPSSVKNVLQGSMSFQSFPQWMEMQKRLAAVMPPVRLNIKALNRTGARFTLQYDGDVMALKRALAGQGIVLGLPTVEVGKSITAGGTTQSEIYDLTLAR